MAIFFRSTDQLMKPGYDFYIVFGKITDKAKYHYDRCHQMVSLDTDF